MLKGLQKFLTTLLLIAGALYLLYQLFLYQRAQALFPPQTTLAGVDVSRLTGSAAADRLREQYYSPITIYHRDEQVEINPQDIGFQIDIDTMLQTVEAASVQEDYWKGYVEFVIGRSLEPITIDLIATHDPQALEDRLKFIAEVLDQPPTSALLTNNAAGIEEGTAGYITDIEASLPLVQEALYRRDNREAHLVILEQDAPERSMELLKTLLEQQLERFDGVGAVFIMDLDTGEEISINGEMAISGLSILKIPIFVETYRVLDSPPDEFVQGLLYDTAVQSSNYGANLLLHIIAGQDNTYLGAEMLTQSMWHMGLVNTFLAVPYDAPEVASRPSTYNTPANSTGDVPARFDYARQTTAEDIGTLLSMVYYCAHGGGSLLAIYPGDFTPDECQAIIDLMVQNTQGNIIRFGVPRDVPVSHKHGWDGVTYGDAGIVLSPNSDYVIVIYVSDPSLDWLPDSISFPLLWQLSQITYNYFNFTDPYLEDPQIRADEALAEYEAQQTATAEAALAAEETAETADSTPTPEPNN
ncbi:MAG: serine hydrolase [Ardenticatenaceae bacterium]|nr:serine hydrolase [Ardenticatenaceae bacterium]